MVIYIYILKRKSLPCSIQNVSVHMLRAKLSSSLTTYFEDSYAKKYLLLDISSIEKFEYTINFTKNLKAFADLNDKFTKHEFSVTFNYGFSVGNTVLVLGNSIVV